MEYSNIDLDQSQVLARTRETLSELIEGWDMGWDAEPRSEVRLVASLLDLLWSQSPKGIEQATKRVKDQRERARVAMDEFDKKLKGAHATPPQ